MPEDRLSAAASPPENVPASAPAASASTRGGIKPWLPLIVTTLFMPLLAWGVAQFILLPQLQKGLNATAANTQAAAKAQKEVPKEKTVAVPMSKLLVNVANTMGARYLMVSLSIVGSGADFKAKINEHDAQLRDVASGVLGSKTLAELEKPGERNLIRNELIAGFNNVLGDSTVQEVYFPEFAIQ